MFLNFFFNFSFFLFFFKLCLLVSQNSIPVEDFNERLKTSQINILCTEFPAPILKKDKDHPNVNPKIILKSPTVKIKRPSANFKEPNFNIDTNLLVPPSANSIIPSLNSKKLLQNEGALDVNLLLKQFDHMDYEKQDESDESNNTTNTSELNDSLEVPIEESEPKFETKNFEKILIYLEVISFLF